MRLNYADVTSTLALLIALSGATAFAAAQLAPGSVGERQLRPGAVTAEKLRKSAVTAPKIKALAIKEGKIANAAVNGSKIASGAIGNDKLAGGAVTTEKIAAEAVTGEKVNEETLGQVPSAVEAGFASDAQSANPPAFAAIDQEGTVDPALSKGIGTADVTLGGEPGVYCVNVPAFSPRGAQLTMAYNNSGGVTGYVKIGGAPGCPSPRVQIQTYSGGARAKAPFYVAFYQ